MCCVFVYSASPQSVVTTVRVLAEGIARHMIGLPYQVSGFVLHVCNCDSTSLSVHIGCCMFGICLLPLKLFIASVTHVCMTIIIMCIFVLPCGCSLFYDMATICFENMLAVIMCHFPNEKMWYTNC